jgi:hypothetical protein
MGKIEYTKTHADGFGSWRLGLDGAVPDHSAFPKNRHGRFRDSDLRRRLLETVLQVYIDERLGRRLRLAADASLIRADHRRATHARQDHVQVEVPLDRAQPARRPALPRSWSASTRSSAGGGRGSRRSGTAIRARLAPRQPVTRRQ